MCIVFPRFIFDKFTERDFSRLLSLETERVQLNEMLINVCKNYEFDGIVIEFWTQLGGRVDDTFLITLVQKMSKYYLTAISLLLLTDLQIYLFLY